MTAQYQAPSVKKAFQILHLISEAKHGLGISELAKRLGMSKGTVHGITSALEEAVAVIRDPVTKKYRIGYSMVELGKKGLSRIPLREIARRHIEELVKETGETVFLGIRRDDHILILDVVESSKELKITSPSGTKIPLLAGAVGKLFLAYMGEGEAVRYLKEVGLTAYTDRTITDLESYLQEIRKVRKTGIATDQEEYLKGVSAVAALIKTDDPILAAIWVVGFSSSLTDKRMHYIIERAIAATNAIAKDLKRTEYS